MSLVRLLVAVALAGGVGLGGLALSRRTTPDRSGREDERVPDRLRPGGGGWSVLGFTSPMCVACKRTPAVVAEALAADEDDLEAGPVRGVGFHAVDVREHGTLVEHLDVKRTPTVAVLDPDGEVVFATEANPDPADLREHLPVPNVPTEEASIGRGAALAVAVPRGDRA